MESESKESTGTSISAQSGIHKESMDYWNDRSRGYNLATRLSLNDEGDGIRRFLRESIPTGHRLKVIDLGTGAGYAAIILAQMGHEVLAVDDSDMMLERARSNARRFRVDIDFIKADIEDLALGQQFDVVVSKDTVWSLMHPASAYYNWAHMLRPGGHMVIMDGNYYLDLYDEDYAKRKRYMDMKNGADNNLHAKTNIDGVDLNRIKRIASVLPLSRERRPSWDLGVMLGIGMIDIHVISLDSNAYSVLTGDGMMRLPSRFAIVARAPYEKDERDDLGYVGEEMMEKLSEGVSSMDRSAIPALKALSDPKRLAIAMALCEGGLSAGQISKITGESPSMVSYSLKALREANIVWSSREGKEIYYRLTDRDVVKDIVHMCEGFSKKS